MTVPRPRMVGTPPRSEWDVAGEKVNGKPADEGMRYVPRLNRTLGWTAVSIASLYEEDSKKCGRPLHFTIAEATAIKSAYWTGGRTITDLAREYGVTAVTIRRLVTGHTYWYV